MTENSPELWQNHMPNPKATDHKYKRGHLLILASSELTGATRLAAMGALKSGVGLVSVISQSKADIYRIVLPADIMVSSDFDYSDGRITAFLAGPGGVDKAIEFNTEEPRPFPMIQDSGALPNPRDLPLSPQRILTPHAGEFVRLFPGLKPEDSIDVLKAARRANAVIVAKGPLTYIADPSGRIIYHDAPNPVLARGGTGDVLAGLLSGLIAQNMPVFEAACAAVWVHSRAAEGKGHSFTATDLVAQIGLLVDEMVI